MGDGETTPDGAEKKVVENKPETPADLSSKDAKVKRSKKKTKKVSRKDPKAKSPVNQPSKAEPPRKLSREEKRAIKQAKEIQTLKDAAKEFESRDYPLWWDEFCVVYLHNGENGSAAFRKARPDVKKKQTIEQNVYRLFNNVEFCRVLKHYKDELRANIEMTHKQWSLSLSQIANVDIRNFVEEVPSGGLKLSPHWKERTDGHALDKIHVKSQVLKTFDNGSWLVGQEVEVGVKGKMKALEMIGKAKGWMEEKVDLTSAGRPLAVVALPPLNYEKKK